MEFYNSCKDVMFSASNVKIISWIGGGAKNWKELVRYLGKKDPTFGSPFQINFPTETMPKDNMEAMHATPKKCNDEDVAYRCACMDCPSVCPILPDVDGTKVCRVGKLPCWSFMVVIIYAGGLILGGAYLFYQGLKYNQKHALFLSADDEDDEGAIISASSQENPKRYALNTFLCDLFSKIGRASATTPTATIGISIFIVGLLSLGWLNFSVETDPVRLWVSPTSDAAREKQFFDNNFGPFYRTQQAFLVNDTTPGGPSPVLSYDTLNWWFDVEQRIRRLKSWKYGVTLDDICLKPTGDACVVQSITAYFRNDFWKLRPETWKDQIQSCADQPAQGQCLPEFGQPLKKEMVFGGMEEGDDVADAKALLVTWVVENHAEGSSAVERSMDWERSLKSTLLAVQGEAKERGLRLSFSTEISLEEELNKSTNTDAKIVVVSYIAMFFYASLALGSTTLALKNMIRQPGKTLVNSKFTLGVFGIIIVLMSVSASVGIFSAMGIKVTLIIAEVIPFLVLAVGVDNIFLIVHEFDRAKGEYPDESVEERIGRAMGRMGPSILLSATSETLSFSLGAMVSMPAVRNFAIYAAGAVFINAILQVTMFVAVLALNQKRVNNNRIDCFPCLTAPSYSESTDSENDRGLDGILGPEGYRSIVGYDEIEVGLIQGIIRQHYAPSLLRKNTKIGVVTIFFGIFAAGLALLPKVELGLDQRIAIPSDSYLIPYFNDLYDYFGAGPPVYFVTKGLNATNKETQQTLCGRFSTCSPLSLSNILEQERKRPEISYITDPAASWIDDFMLWLNPSLEQCCSVKRSDHSQFCGPNDNPFQCQPCFQGRDSAWNITLGGMPEGEEFMKYLKVWIDASTGEQCPIAGKAAYSSAIVPNYDDITITASHFRTSHKPLTNQQEFIEAYASARRIAKDVSRTTGTEVFPYSKFYIFFDQYSTIVRLTVCLIVAALVCIFIVSAVLLGSLRTGAVVAGTVAMIVVNIIGVMAIWGVSLNAVSLVNLVICIGIGVEFCSHIARAFMFPAGVVVERSKDQFHGKDARAFSALVNVGGSVRQPLFSQMFIITLITLLLF
jgi:Niemann-Pick C1 protein